MSGRRYTPVQMIESLCGFDTTSAKSNLALIDWVDDYLAGHGVRTLRSHNPENTKANLFASFGPEEAGGVVLSGHTDVVPVDGQPWDSDPFTVVEKGGRLYGRGTSDMKSFLACALALAPEMQARRLKVPLHIAMSFDEEVGCLGVRHLLKQIREELPPPRIVIIGEPTMMQIINAHKGVYGFETLVTGLDGHSSATHRGVNAIHYAAELIGLLETIAEEKRAAAEPGCPFDPPYTTICVGVIQGGTAHNIIPRSCKFVWQYRLLSGESPDEIPGRLDAHIRDSVLPRMRAVHPGADVVTTATTMTPGLTPELDSPAEALVRQLTGLNQTGVVAFGTEAGLFQQAGLSTVIFGPGDIAQAHTPNEFIALEQVAACDAFLNRLLDWACR